ncbi:hypothetical protein JW968_04490 [Candidatus Woesearchaeota archaeon]|nr:hypothetical protein [Candidatus Woesearchaeota archaeon]
MNHSVKKGVSFGLTSGIVTTLGLMVGLNSGTHARNVVLGGILIIAVADAMSDAFGIHISEEAEFHHTQKEIWQSTLATFISKLILASTFAVPILLADLQIAVIMNILWGFFLIIIMSLYIAKHQKISKWHVLTEHISITALVIVVTYFLGAWVATL